MWDAAASTRLCVETAVFNHGEGCTWQPPPRGCVLKRTKEDAQKWINLQPPPRGCVLKPRSTIYP